MQRWKPIKSAPKDGTLVLLYGKGCNFAYIKTGYYDADTQMYGYPNWKWGLTFNPTHWIKLPNPPK